MIFSIIVPVYNVEDFIYDCLNSILNQSLDKSEYEIICVDDCGSDKSVSIIEKLKDTYSEIKISLVYHKKNMGLSMARNTGILNAKGDYIILLDSDDYLVNDSLSKIKYYLNNEIDILECSVIDQIETNSDVIPSLKCSLEIATESGDEYYYIKSHSNEYMPMSCIRIYRREFLLKTKLFKTGIYFEDEEFTPRIMMAANKCRFVDIPFYVYRRREGSITTSISKSNKWINDYQTIAKCLLELSDTKQYKSINLLRDTAANLILSLVRNVAYFHLDGDVFNCVANEIRKNDLYKIVIKSKTPKIRVQGYLLRFPKFYYSVYSFAKRTKKNEQH